MPKVVAIIIPFLLLAGCGADPIATAQTDNPNVAASLIGRVDGCNIWRINDGRDRTIYFARCNNGAVGMQWEELVGKMIYHRETLGDL